MNQFQPLQLFERHLAPRAPCGDLAVDFERDPVRLQTQNLHQPQYRNPRFQLFKDPCLSVDNE